MRFRTPLATSGPPVALVTGGAQGIGKALTLRMLALGFRVAVLDNDREALRELARQTRAAAGRLLPIPCDVALEPQVRRALSLVRGRFRALDFLVNNAAIARNMAPGKLTLKDWNRVLAVNLTAPFLLVRHGLPLFRKGRGAVVNLCSTRAFMSEPRTEAYSASKGGLFALTHALAVSLGPSIRVNSVSPGWIEVSALRKVRGRSTPVLTEQDHTQHPVGRVGRAEDVTEMVLYLLSDRAGFITGQNFFVDGGMTRKMIYA